MKKIAVLLIALYGFTTGTYAQETIEGADGVEVEIGDLSRIITIGGSITETVFALGEGGKVIAVDESSSYPQEVAQLPQVPYLRNLNAEGILSLSPTFIFASDEANPITAIQQMRDAGTNVLLVKEEESMEGVISKIGMIGKVLGKGKQANELIRLNKKQYQQADSLRSTFTSKPKVLFILAKRGKSTLMVAGNNTGAQKMIELAGGENAMNNMNGYKTASLESIAAANPDFIIFMKSRTSEINESLKTTPAIQYTTAVKNDQTHGIDGNFLLGFGPRFGEAVLDLMKYIHPETDIEL